jgi:hypothetical protein
MTRGGIVAEIRIDRKSGPSPWLWVVGLVVVALVIWGVVEFMGDDRRAGDTAPETAAPAAEQYQVEPQPQPYTPATPDDPAAPRDPAAPQGQGTP